ncbi:MAG: deoxycytidylate deaminase [Parcubacteria group bacterium]|nr:deoxycytidylate deaminase [Parcubacteria group bacterium]
MKTLVVYVPVLHDGYLKFFEKQEGKKRLFLFGSTIIAGFAPLAKEIRELDPERMRKAIESLGIFESVEVLDMDNLKELNVPDATIILPDEDVSRSLAHDHLSQAEVSFDPIFLRWDKHNALKEKPVVPDEQITTDELHRRFMAVAEKDSEKSSDIWRHVGAAIAKGGELISVTHNTHVPSEHMPYVNGDPRSNFHKGEYLELSTAIHAEAALIAEAARKGTSLEGADMYVTVFPCPPCAKLIAYAGIKNLYCGGGYGVLDGEDILKSRGVNILFVE